MSMTRLLIAASGTGGHLFPALAVAEALPPDWSIHWLGVPDRLERELVPSRFPLHTVRAGGLQGRGLKKLWQLLRLLAATGTVRRLIRREGVDLVFSTGGYIAAPAILAARWCGVPVVLHESNAVPGRVTRLLGRLCSQVALGLPQAQVVVTGDERTALHGAAAAGRGHHGGGQAAATRTAGILLISGTGCIGLGRNLQGAEHRCGGWGWLLDGAGSALDIGRDGLALSLQMADGRLHDGPLRRALWEALEQTPDDPAAAQAIKALVVQPGFSPAGLARLAPVVDQLARSGDTGALAIMERSGAALAAMAATIATRLGLEAPVVWTSGGALLHLPTLRSALQHQLANQCPTATLEAPGGDACDGALLLAQERAAGQVFKPR